MLPEFSGFKGLKTYDEKYDRIQQLQLICTDYMFPTATAVEMVLTMLVEQMLMHPEVQEKIHEEIDRDAIHGGLY
ncbi:unnamed protein product [Leptidea sinapis]|uniref:Uncharacterized protein n=1 Tax=Leptidea sinapis TaxID=189913 RepID=A0A5E4R4S8_9NEOP|nr:unnamed protein product [Leptidea sinapis]